ncbi:hypothetical protein F5Y16DRAFT_420352 [Xylariaceae sp. FL0255]|nr:hypothetical protein F5Y16DRAFT_420352 [Xylariaceae sp. FL0255]
MSSLSPRCRGGGEHHHKIVCLDAVWCPPPTFDFPHEYVEYGNTEGEDLIAERARDATIILTQRVPVSARTVEACPRLELIVFMASGTEIADHDACRARGIIVYNMPGANAETVAEHAFALYLAAKRQIINIHRITLAGDAWPGEKSLLGLYPRPPRGLKREILGIVGYGAIGSALGMSVLIAERKHVEPDQVREERVSFQQVISTCTVLMLCCPLDKSSTNTISEPELQTMRPDSIIVNVARGAVMDEAALLRALQQGWISAAATDVFVDEPATKESSRLVRECPSSLTLSPHIAWYGDSSLENVRSRVKQMIETYVAGEFIDSVL